MASRLNHINTIFKPALKAPNSGLMTISLKLFFSIYFIIGLIDERDRLINFVERWNVCMFARNENVELKYKNKKIIGKAIGIDESGNLLIEKNSKILTVNDTNYSMRVSG